MRKRNIVAVLAAALGVGPFAFASPWTPEADYPQTFFITPNGDARLVAPMIGPTLGPDGAFVRLGVSTGLYYNRWTQGPAHDYRFDVRRTPGDYRTDLLPPDVASLDELPPVIREHLPAWVTSLAMVPRFVADIEWARYHGLPVSIQIQAAGPQGGMIDDTGWDMDIWFETSGPEGASQGKDNCMWDLSDKMDPDDDPTTIDDAGFAWGSMSFATPTLVDPAVAAELGYDLRYTEYMRRNLQDGVRQIIEIFSDPRYSGLLLAFTYDPEIHYPTFWDDTLEPSRAFITDYHPAMVRAFGHWLRDHYGDDTPLEDSNGDGATFWSEFGAEYPLTRNQAHPYTGPPATWTDIDPPRQTLDGFGPPKGRYWQAWANFRVDVIKRWLEQKGEWLREAGVPPERIFTHQTTATGSQNANRANWADEEWLDDWSHIELSGGVSGLSVYQPFSWSGGDHLGANMARRDDGYGLPEFNPFVIAPGAVWANAVQVQNAMEVVWNTRAHVIWPHAWGDRDYPVVDNYSTVWTAHPSTLVPTDWSASGWTQTPGSLVSNTAYSHLESPPLALDAATHPWLLVTAWFGVVGDGGEGSPVPFRIYFQTSEHPEWSEARRVDGFARGQTWGQRTHPVHMAAHPEWSGTVTRLRLQPFTRRDQHLSLRDIAATGDNHFTTELRTLVAARRDSPRPTLYSPHAVALPFALDGHIADFPNLVVFGTDLNADFGWQGNFQPVTGIAGGQSRRAIAASAPQRLGLRKTGKWRRLLLPADQPAQLRVSIALADGSDSIDGVGFRAMLRDPQRGLHTLVDRIWRHEHWSEEMVVDLSPWAGQEINLRLETRGLSDPVGDQALWGAPRLLAVALFSSGFEAEP